MIKYSYVIYRSNGVTTNKADSQGSLPVVNAHALQKVIHIVFRFGIGDGGIIEGKGISVGVVAYSSAYTLKVGDIVVVFFGYLCTCN